MDNNQMEKRRNMEHWKVSDISKNTTFIFNVDSPQCHKNAIRYRTLYIYEMRCCTFKLEWMGCLINVYGIEHLIFMENEMIIASWGYPNVPWQLIISVLSISQFNYLTLVCLSPDLIISPLVSLLEFHIKEMNYPLRGDV